MAPFRKIRQDFSRSVHTHGINKERVEYGLYHHLFPALKKDPKKFKDYLRMDILTFYYILSKIEKRLSKSWCNLHSRPIYPEEKLMLTLCFLADGTTFSRLKFTFRMGVSTVSKSIYETCRAIWEEMQPIHMPIPKESDFVRIADDFQRIWGFPNCIGAIDGRHVNIKKPAKSGSLYFNYKHYFSIVLQALVDARYKYIAIDVGGYGRQSDGGTFKASKLYKAIKENKIKLPSERKLPNSGIILPFCFVGDGAYPLMEKLMVPFNHRGKKKGHRLADIEIQFNKQLSRARVTVECTYGFTSQKWRIYYTEVQVEPKNIQLFVETTCILHNILIDCEDIIVPENHNLNHRDLPVNFARLQNVEQNVNDFAVGHGAEVRNEYAKHFANHTL